MCLDIARDQLPPADLILCRDCLVHLPFEQMLSCAPQFPPQWRPLNLRKPPYNLSAALRMIVEGCTEADSAYRDKSLGLWELSKINPL